MAANGYGHGSGRIRSLPEFIYGDTAVLQT